MAIEIVRVAQMRSGQFCFARQPCLQNFNLSNKSELLVDCRNFTRLDISARLDEAMSRSQITEVFMFMSIARATDTTGEGRRWV